MKEQVINFLGQLPESNSEQFNQAMELFRKSKGHDAGQLRYYNTLGFSKDRLESLLYDLKMLHNITDLQVANSKRQQMKVVKEDDAPSSHFDNLSPENLESLKREIKDLDLENISAEKLSFTALAIKTAFNMPDDIAEDKVLVLAFQKDLKAVEDVSNKIAGKKVDVVDPATLQISAEELGTKELSEKFEDHISANQIDVNDAQDLSAPLEVTKDAASDTIVTSKEERDAHEAAAKAERLTFLKEDLANFDLEAEKYNSIKSFAATLSDYLNEDPKDQKSETLKAFVAEAKKKYSQS